MSIGSCTTWECINSFANWLSACGTILITGFALWLSVRDRRISLKSSLTLGLVPSANANILNRPVFALSFTNIGIRPVTITSHCWKLPFTKGFVFLHPYLDIETGRLCSKLPMDLTDGKEGYAFYPDNFFSKLENPQAFLFPENRYIAWLRIFFFRVYIITTVGTRSSVRISRSVRTSLWREYKETHLPRIN
ncbi:hypothetical protein [Pseudomonas sp. 28 E 9]|nr:hypothetical protein [Pseudomonas sp. 28 E 9]